MSLKIIKKGLLDTVQDGGRYGFQHLGINPNGAIDRFAAALANALLGKEEIAPTLEMHFPAAEILFQEATIICITGGDFSPEINDAPIPLNQPIIVSKNTKLNFKKWVRGARCYLAALDDLVIEEWLNSSSTHLIAKAGGWHGRSLQTEDVIPFKRKIKHFPLPNNAFTILPWRADIDSTEITSIQFMRGREWNWLTERAKHTFVTSTFRVTNNSDRMGYRLSGEMMGIAKMDQLVTAGVNFGTVQLLPNGQLIILMADHQTTGGYPKVAHVISTHLPLLAQMLPGASFRFKETDLLKAEQALLDQKKYILHLKNACRFNIEKVLNATM